MSDYLSTDEKSADYMAREAGEYAEDRMTWRDAAHEEPFERGGPLPASTQWAIYRVECEQARVYGHPNPPAPTVPEPPVEGEQLF